MVDEVNERNVEQALMDRLQDTLMEFGRGMAFVGRQCPLTVTDETGDVDEFAVDLLLFNIPQSRYVVVELKMGKFHPSYVGQLGTYVAILDGQLRDRERHAPTIGLLLCTEKNTATVKYSLGSTSVPMGIADYQGLPDDARAALPSADELEAVVEEELSRHASEE